MMRDTSKTDPPVYPAHPHRPVPAVDRARSRGLADGNTDGDSYGNIDAGRRDRSIWL